jgi:hypothetical protein
VIEVKACGAPNPLPGAGPLEVPATIESLPAGTAFIGAWKVGGRNVNVGASTALRANHGPMCAQP